MDIGQVKALLHLAASRLESRKVKEDREIAELLRLAEQALDGKERAMGPKIVASSPMNQALSWESRSVGQELNASSLSEDVE